MKRAAKPKLGDVYEVEVDGGYGYLHYIGKHKGYGDTIRVSPRVFTIRPSIDGKLFEDAYVTFYPVGAAIAERLIAPVGNLRPIDIPTTLRRPGAILERQIRTWIIESPQKEKVLSTLSEGDKSLPIAEIWNHELLKESIRRGWRPEKVVTSYEF